MNQVSVVQVTEPLEDDAVPRWEQLIFEVASRRPRELVLDLAGADRIDENALVLLLRVNHRMTVGNGRLVLRGLNTQMRRTLSYGRADRVFDIV
ncbi:STAS domain-containing protein [Actinoplanes sp. NPDC051851]|uniref:STAS domain-containing protein n=1 Tax=Actinoplanes sp. NPDC051851 TaxID=3154753 RepID=UPI003416777D